jgi:hypothetical protein
MLKARRTAYKGYKFSSRLEARWAYFLDLMGVAWQYEPEALDLDGLTYIPDFHLTQHRLWLEIKGDLVTDAAGVETIDKCKRLARISSRPVILAYHDPLDARLAVFGVKGGLYTQAHFTCCQECSALGVFVRTPTSIKFICPAGHTSTEHAQPEARRFMYQAALAARQIKLGVAR